jgi:hypothetical protein
MIVEDNIEKQSLVAKERKGEEAFTTANRLERIGRGRYLSSIILDITAVAVAVKKERPPYHRLSIDTIMNCHIHALDEPYNKLEFHSTHKFEHDLPTYG